MSMRRSKSMSRTKAIESAGTWRASGVGLSESAIDETETAARVLGLQEFGQGIVGEALVAHGTHEAIDARGADAGEEAVAGRRIRTAVVHGGTDFDSGGEAIEDDAAYLALQDAHEVGVIAEVFRRAVNGRRELTVQRAGEA